MIIITGQLDRHLVPSIWLSHTMGMYGHTKARTHLSQSYLSYLFHSLMLNHFFVCFFFVCSLVQRPVVNSIMSRIRDLFICLNIWWSFTHTHTHIHILLYNCVHWWLWFCSVSPILPPSMRLTTLSINQLKIVHSVMFGVIQSIEQPPPLPPLFVCSFVLWQSFTQSTCLKRVRPLFLVNSSLVLIGWMAL